MKASKYNLYVDRGNCVICYNTIADNFLLLSPIDYKKILNNILELEHFSPKVYQSLIDGGFIIEDSKDEITLLKEEYEQEANHSRTYDLTLLPTLDCNLRCWYCYEKHNIGTHYEANVPNSIVLHVKNVFDKYPSLERLSITLYGGEPLMYFKKELYPLLSKLKELMDGLKKGISFFFITNAVYITEEMIPLFEHLGVGFQISIDGFREKHNKVKYIPATKEGTFDRVMETVRMLTSKMNNVFINLRINYDDNTLPHLTELISEIQDVDRRKIAIHFERVWQTSENAINYDNKLLQHIIETFINSGFTVSYLNFNRKSLSCKSSSNQQIIISYDGKVYKCTGRDFTDSFSDGKLQDTGEIVWKQEQIQKRMDICTYASSKCLSCAFLPQCWGPCNQKQLESDNIERFCPLNTMEMELNEYLALRLKNRYMREQMKEQYSK